MIKYPSIEQFRNTVREVSRRASFQGLYSDGEPIMQKPDTLPTLTFRGTVKLHGTNASVVMYPDGQIVSQSRNRVLTLESDNAGFAFFVEQNKEKFIEFFSKFGVKPFTKPITVYGEWCGGNIQKGVAISELEKMFIIFAVRVGEDDDTRWMNPVKGSVIPDIDGVYSIAQFPMWVLNIDFNRPELAVNEMIKITEEIERECPVGKQFGISGIGEGAVWSCVDDLGGCKYTNLRFKVKGEKHSVSKVKKLATVDVEKLNSISEFVEMVVTENRVQQGIDFLQEQGKDVSIKQTGDVVRWVVGDVMKEEVDTLIASGLEPKDVNASVGKASAKLFHKILDNEVM